MIAVNFCRAHEIPAVSELFSRFPDNMVGISHLETPYTTWRVRSMQKYDVSWTRRILEYFLDDLEADILIKIDPDTVIEGDNLPIPSIDFDVAGDFRKHRKQWLWFGGYHVFTRNAAENILADAKYQGAALLQDAPLTDCVKRTGLRAVNMLEVNCCKLKGDCETIISHRGEVDISRNQFGRVDFSKEH